MNPVAVRTAVLPGYDRTPLFVRHWHSEEQAVRATAVLAHGYAEHSGRYGALAARLAQRGIALVTYDQRGFGRSGGAPAFVHSFNEYVADLHAVASDTRERFAGPLFLMGHSMGGAVVLLYALDHGARPAGLVLSSPLLRPTEGTSALERRLSMPWLLQCAARVVSRLTPALPTVHLDRDAISRDEEVVAEVLADPLCYTGRVRARTGAEMIRATRRVEAKMGRLALPFLLFHGTADRLTAPGGSRALYARARSADKTLRLYDGFYHETFNDPGGQRVLTDIADWLDERASLDDRR